MLREHPKALRIFIPTEMSETYGYFTVQAILVFYLMKGLSFTDANAYAFAGQFIALAYIMPVVGGWLADHLLGNRRAIWVGGVFLCCGYALVALNPHLLLSGLSLVAVGNGLLKPNISSFIGEFYPEGDPRREAGFTLVYTGISIGALVAIAGVGYIQKWLGWSACFASASLALLLGMSVFRWGYHFFDGKGFPPRFSPLRVAGILLILLVLAYCALRLASFGTEVVDAFGILFCLYVGKIAWGLNTSGRRALLAIMILFVISIFYKAMFFETYLAVNVFTDRLVDRSVWGHQIPAPTFLSLASLFTIVIGPLFAKMWQSNLLKLSITCKFALSLLLVGLAMQMLALWIHFSPGVVLPTSSIVLFRLIFAVSELFILPLGLAMVTEYAPKHCMSLLMGGWFLTAAYGGKLAGSFADLADIPPGMTDLSSMQAIYHHAFNDYALLNYGLFALTLCLIPLINALLRKEPQQ